MFTKLNNHHNNLPPKRVMLIKGLTLWFNMGNKIKRNCQEKATLRVTGGRKAERILNKPLKTLRMAGLPLAGWNKIF
jgi:hypothetical protein